MNQEIFLKITFFNVNWGEKYILVNNGILKNSYKRDVLSTAYESVKLISSGYVSGNFVKFDRKELFRLKSRKLH
jgi:hypothetical protein